MPLTGRFQVITAAAPFGLAPLSSRDANVPDLSSVFVAGSP